MRKIIKKSGMLVDYDFNKIITAVSKSAERVNIVITNEMKEKLSYYVELEMDKLFEPNIPVEKMHFIVECALEEVEPKIAKSYRNYRNYKIEHREVLEKLFESGKSVKYLADKNNANTDSSLISTQRVLLLRKLAGEMYERFELTEEERQEIRTGAYYIHDKDDRWFTMNCCLFDFGNVLKNGFEMANMEHTEPGSLEVAMSVTSDIALSAASQQYGGFTLPEIDTVFEPYMLKSYNKYLEEYFDIVQSFSSEMIDYEKLEIKADEYALMKLEREMEQGFQGWEYKFNTLSSSRGDYPFISITFGLSTTLFGKMFNKACLKVRKNGQGKPGFTKPVLFPKLIFLYTDKLHGIGKECEDVFNSAIECSSKSLYPDSKFYELV